jgi:hypothetical protein
MLLSVLSIPPIQQLLVAVTGSVPESGILNGINHSTLYTSVNTIHKATMVKLAPAQEKGQPCGTLDEDRELIKQSSTRQSSLTSSRGV